MTKTKFYAIITLLLLNFVHLTVSAISNSDKLVVGYWHNWNYGAGYKGGVAQAVSIEEVNPMYNIVNVSFMKVYDTNDGRIPTFKLDTSISTEEEFIKQIKHLHDQKRLVILALGGADAHIDLLTGDADDFAIEIIRLCDYYGFDGLDIDLEQSAITAANNNTVIPVALKIVKDHYKTQGKHFYITMAPEFPYLRENGKYIPYIKALEGYYDWINPQFYNQNGDGIWIDGLGYLKQNDDSVKENFIYYIADSIINGTRGYHKIPHDKLVFGIPANVDAAANGFIENPQALYDAFEKLESQGQPLKGVMTWSINWDVGLDASGKNYQEKFINDYGSFIHSNSLPTKETPVLFGVKDQKVKHNSNFDPLKGISATDEQDGDISKDIKVSGYVNTAKIGNYPITYSITDADGNITTKTCNIEVYSQKPFFTGVDNEAIAINTSFDPLEGVNATDAEDGDITNLIEVSGAVDSSIEGSYKLTYSVTDSAGQTIEAIRIITVGKEITSKFSFWNPLRVYIKNDIVLHNNRLWAAKWWTRNDEPGTTGKWGVWKEITENIINKPAKSLIFLTL